MQKFKIITTGTALSLLGFSIISAQAQEPTPSPDTAYIVIEEDFVAEPIPTQNNIQKNDETPSKADVTSSKHNGMPNNQPTPNNTKPTPNPTYNQNNTNN